MILQNLESCLASSTFFGMQFANSGDPTTIDKHFALLIATFNLFAFKTNDSPLGAFSESVEAKE